MKVFNSLKNMGFKFDSNLFIDENHPHCNIKEMNYTADGIFYVKFNRIPSINSYKTNTENRDKLFQAIKDSNYQVFSIIEREFTYHINFINYAGTMVSIRISPKIFDHTHVENEKDGNESKVIEDEDEDETIISYDILYDSNIAPEYHEMLNNLSSFNKKITEAEKGKVLIFEKNEFGELVLNPYRIKGYDLDITKNYNDDFVEVDEKLKNWVGDFKLQNQKLVLFNGPPGTGKTNYLKYLINNTPNIKKIYIPPYFVQSIADPSFFPIIRREQESLLIIEDAEKILVNREDQADNSTISILLNLCDGMMADILNFKIIATFNTDEDKIDEALKRKGRMFMKYKFDKLESDKAFKLYEEVHGNEPEHKTSMSLAEIYNNENEFGKKKEPKRTIGFGI